MKSGPLELWSSGGPKNVKILIPEIRGILLPDGAEFFSISHRAITCTVRENMNLFNLNYSKHFGQRTSV